MLKLDDNQVVEAKEIYNRLVSVYKEKASYETLKKQREDRLKEEIASICDVRDKEGNALASKVKMPLLLAVIMEKYRDKDNAKEIEYETMQRYKKALKDIDVEVINGFLHCVDEVAETKSSIKEVFADSTLLDKDTCKALDDLAKEQYKTLLADEMEKAGYEQKGIKDNSEFEEIKDSLIKILDIGA
ncbi:hypothetical protein KDE13_09100 [Campylobacter sp. faydin G-140]|uniref:hypothetical protein n=1 Tax=Campylobacter anatolicus TaxID=2829105 RepID=UPI001B8F3FF9|nr:hypothetical protein [Campylobacter anatolicus]MBR8466490.1 hypothetical protein [Campylobacter anatolicus]